MKMEIWQLRQRQSLPLGAKETLSTKRISQWYEHWNGEVYVSFSGGKDSTVLLHLVRKLYPHVPAVFVDTGLEYPEIRNFVKTIDNVTWIKPKMQFYKVIEKYGYPVISKKQADFISDVQNKTDGNKATVHLRLTGYSKAGKYVPSMKISKKWLPLIDAPFKISDKCCDVMKKYPLDKYTKETGRKAIVGTMAAESNRRELTYLQYGCNAYDGKVPKSNPLSVWSDDDVWEYIKKYNVHYSKIYDMGYRRTGCMFCMFGLHLEANPNRFQLMQKTHPKQYEYCMNTLGCDSVLNFIGIAH